MQLRRFLPMYAEVIDSLILRYPSNRKLNALYHKDVVGRYLCRILNLFMTTRTRLLTADYLEWVYGMMDADKELRVFSVRTGQIFNVILYRIGKVKFSIGIYRFISRMVSLFRK